MRASVHVSLLAAMSALRAASLLLVVPLAKVINASGGQELNRRSAVTHVHPAGHGGELSVAGKRPDTERPRHLIVHTLSKRSSLIAHIIWYCTL
jgi:hypothetical protein